MNFPENLKGNSGIILISCNLSIAMFHFTKMYWHLVNNLHFHPKDKVFPIALARDVNVYLPSGLLLLYAN